MRPTTNAKIQKSIIERARLIATHRRVSVSDYLSDTLEPAVARDYAEMVRQLAEGVQGADKPPRANHDPPGPASRWDDPNLLPPEKPPNGPEKKTRRRGGGMNGSGV